MEFEILQERRWGQPKLTIPKELKGHKRVGSASWFGGRCMCPVYVIGTDIFIKMRDWFSEEFQCEEIGTPINFRLKKYFPDRNLKPESFIYADNWSSIILRSEAWVVFRNCKLDYNFPARCVRVMFHALGQVWYERDDFCEWLRLYENVMKVVLEKTEMTITHPHLYEYEQL